MNEAELLSKHCVEYPQGTATLEKQAIDQMLPLVPGWELVDDGRGLRFSRRMDDFMAAVDLVNKVAGVAEEEQHHPDIRISGYRTLTLDLSTHSIGGLSENDFIMAAKINQLLK
jgi:4a-hydroxytetrahydrobiopterin dehydratase